MAAWLTREAALVLINKDEGDLEDVASFDGALAAAVDHVERKRSDLATGEPPVFDAPADVRLGTAMLANRWYERRSAPLGVAQFSEFGSGSILRYDPDIAKLLGIGRDGGFVVGGTRSSVL